MTDVPYRFVLHELGGMSSYFTAGGDLVARIDALGARTDWLRDELDPHRVVAVVNPDGAVTTLDWESVPGSVLVRPGANLPGETDPLTGAVGERPEWRVELDGGRLSAVVDPIGGRFSVSYDDQTGLVSSMTAIAGGSTEV